MITLIMLIPLINMIFNYNINLKSEDNYFDLMSILEILIIFSMSYIFEYGYEIQTESNGIMYNE